MMYDIYKNRLVVARDSSEVGKMDEGHPKYIYMYICSIYITVLTTHKTILTESCAHWKSVLILYRYLVAGQTGNVVLIHTSFSQHNTVQNHRLPILCICMCIILNI